VPRFGQPFTAADGTLTALIELSAIPPGELHIAEFPLGLVSRFRLGCARADEFRCAHVEMKAQLVIEVGANTIAGAPREEKAAQLLESWHCQWGWGLGAGAVRQVQARG